jgi:regulator of sigma E protease
MSVIIFILILGALIFVHELGHFLVAKKNGIRVDEFAIGFPPKIFSVEKKGTKYVLNAIPFGGYVKIFGENPDEESIDPNAKDSFINKSRWVQAGVLVAGVVFNVIFAWFLFVITLTSGMPAVVTDENLDDVRNPFVVITSIAKNSVAEQAEIKVGDIILSISNENELIDSEINIESIRRIIEKSESEIALSVSRRGEIQEIILIPELETEMSRRMIGISMETVGTYSLPIHKAFLEAFVVTGNGIKNVFRGIGMLFGMIFSGEGSFGYVAGPIGIVSLVSDAAQFGWANVLGFAAFLSLNLAVLNIMPFPALDGGRLLLLGIEGVIRKRINPKIANTINAIGFSILILLMIIITVSDVIKLF